MAKECPKCRTIEEDRMKFCTSCGYDFERRLSEARPGQIGQAAAIGGLVFGIAGMMMPYFAAVFLIPVSFVFSIIAVIKNAKLGFLGLIIGAIGLYGIVAVSSKITEALAPFDANAKTIPASQRFSASDFNRVRSGMSYDQVEQIVGSGEELSRTELGGYTSVMYSWKNPNGSNMNAMFQDGKLISKAQFGLK